ncbi:MAG: hypothetical protein A3I73_05285 [Omnitrophica bacterium RIFCSPLOWO2_02_FULL_45_16]|nr:MAG: hypothetical protein A3C51_00615 [Omnitrophica bacterium RIFCSPHIGHO2_02_FULL_46_20]OGW93721.1 MAG: hypothetical protein A3K16_01855 [Omnitrophica bacterium RIFCSPLOWO2_01_FULL_45_24]OGW94065.1 MAG: hypothetical protein A3G36_02785 [Omnitrophica bacterium RIFCSPLOWO2_12_FULL_45_13]OGX00873.1 MAG: hypothetical protein A3I73_05285 [Omnitrophica bacterium RIFCSPLOWO2_02_FULL_45_16]
MIERRISARFNTMLKTLCGIGREKIKSSSELKNISKEGALLILDVPLDRDSELDLSVDVPGDNVPIFMSARVAWQKELISEPKKKIYETGVKFAQIDEFDRGRFFELICSQWLKLYERE